MQGNEAFRMPRRSEYVLSLLNQNRIIFRRVKDKKGLVHSENFLRYFLLLNVINQLLADNEGSAGKLDRIAALKPYLNSAPDVRIYTVA